MTPLFKKLNLKSETSILVLDAPESFEPELASLDGVKVVRSAAKTKEVSFAMAFVTTLAGVEKATAQIDAKAVGDVIVWMVYPKQTSKKYKCEFNRDTGWNAMRSAGFDTVRQVAYAVASDEKRALLQHLLESKSIAQAIVFASTQIECDGLANDLQQDGFDAVALRGDQDRAAAERALGFFAARGHYQGDVKVTKPVFGRAA